MGEMDVAKQISMSGDVLRAARIVARAARQPDETEWETSQRIYPTDQFPAWMQDGWDARVFEGRAYVLEDMEDVISEYRESGVLEEFKESVLSLASLIAQGASERIGNLYKTLAAGCTAEMRAWVTAHEDEVRAAIAQASPEEKPVASGPPCGACGEPMLRRSYSELPYITGVCPAGCHDNDRANAWEEYRAREIAWGGRDPNEIWEQEQASRRRIKRRKHRQP